MTLYNKEEFIEFFNNASSLQEVQDKFDITNKVIYSRVYTLIQKGYNISNNNILSIKKQNKVKRTPRAKIKKVVIEEVIQDDLVPGMIELYRARVDDFINIQRVLINKRLSKQKELALSNKS